MAQDLKYKPLLDHAFKILNVPDTPDFSIGVKLEPIRYLLQDLFGTPIEFPDRIIQTDFKIEDNYLDGVMTLIDDSTQYNPCLYARQVLSFPNFGKYYISVIDSKRLLSPYILNDIDDMFLDVLDYDKLVACQSRRSSYTFGTPYYDARSIDYFYMMLIFTLMSKGVNVRENGYCQQIVDSSAGQWMIEWFKYNINDPDLLTYTKLISFLGMRMQESPTGVIIPHHGYIRS